MIRLLSSISAILSGMWIAGYLAIVLPVITGRMEPGSQNGNFTYWADAGWAVLIALLLIGAALIALLLKRKHMIFCLLLTIALLGICASQYFGAKDTHAVANYYEQRNSTHDNTHHYKEFDKKLKVAHKSSERSIGMLILFLLGNMAIQLTLVTTNAADRKPDDA